jgi:hypothetical protein
MEIPHYTRQDPADVIFDDGINLTALDYIITDQDVSCAATVKAGNSSASFMSTFLYNDVLLKRYKEEMLEVAWADTYMKKYAVACAYLRLSYDKFRTLNVGVVGDPRLQIWDRVGIRERTSSQTWIWHIKGLQTTISADNGFFQVLDLAVNYDVKLTHPPLPSDISPIQVTVPTIRLQVWDFSREDGDVMNIYKDGVKIKSNYEIKNDPINIDIDLNYGDNVITFEGVSCGTLATLSGRLKVMDTSNNILFNSGSLPDLEMARTNCNSSGIYSKRPVKTWIVARVYPPTP